MKFIVLFQQVSMHHIYNDIFHQAAVSQSFSNIRINIMSFICLLHIQTDSADTLVSAEPGQRCATYEPMGKINVRGCSEVHSSDEEMTSSFSVAGKRFAFKSLQHYIFRFQNTFNVDFYDQQLKMTQTGQRFLLFQLSEVLTGC